MKKNMKKVCIGFLGFAVVVVIGASIFAKDEVVAFTDNAIQTTSEFNSNAIDTVKDTTPEIINDMTDYNESLGD